MTRLATLALLLAAASAAGLCGCAGLNPIKGVPLRQVDPALLAGGRPRTQAKTIDLSLLQRPRPPAHVVDAGDVLGVYVEGLFGEPEDPPPVSAPIQLDANGLTTVTRPAPELGYPLTVGRDCTIGHRAILHGCTIGDGSLVGMGAIVLNGARIGRACLIGAGALIPEGREIPDGSLVVGAPGKVVRELDEATRDFLIASAQAYVANASRFRDGLTAL